METKNVHQKYSEAVEKFHELKMDKSGKNNHMKFNFFELADFLPHILKIERGLGLKSHVTFPEDRAQLIMVNLNDPADKIVFDSRMGKSNLPKAHDVQNLGSSHTYMRRYMYVLAYDILEKDGLDGSIGDPDSAPASTNASASAPAKIPMTPESEKAFVAAINSCDTMDKLKAIYTQANTTHTLSKGFKDAKDAKKQQLEGK